MRQLLLAAALLLCGCASFRNATESRQALDFTASTNDVAKLLARERALVNPDPMIALVTECTITDVRCFGLGNVRRRVAYNAQTGDFTFDLETDNSSWFEALASVSTQALTGLFNWLGTVASGAANKVGF